MATLNRRQFLAGAALTPWTARPVRAAELIIDTHTHIYSAEEERYPPIPDPLYPPGESGRVETLRRRMRENGVAGACLVQTSSFYGYDNRFTCDTAARTRAWSAGVCTLDPDDPSAPPLIPRYVREFNIHAMRSRPAKDGRMDSPGVQELWKGCGNAGIVVNILCNRDNTDAVARMLEKFNRQPIVIDHCLNLKAGPEMERTLAAMLRLAKFPNTHAKLTFLATGSAEEYPFRDMHGPCRKIIDAYTPDRCIWGSGFPNQLWTPKATYAQNLTLFTEQLGLPAAAKTAILGATANRLYFAGRLE